ncbi:MAG: hypothetical protein IIZ38_08300 [Sphingomonas sp.]|uniref:hypothetical protein n=1 Tax=Sphingomonas sp. TaxID=28214 RepID=UPI0025EF7361|nr:hypothetical protein [Sphingomonas sp.]MBQ1498301.1 hypothetical protein [Sphingomonas sp.]
MLNAIAFVALALAPQTASPLLRDADPKLFAGAATACLRHLAIDRFDPDGLVAEGWSRHSAAELPERPFRDWVPLFSRGDGVILAAIGPSGKPHGCVVVAKLVAGTDQAAARAALIDALKSQPVHEKDGDTLWAIGGIVLLLHRDKHLEGALDITIGTRSTQLPLQGTQ